ncbi:hypothetical protein R6Z07F_013796 [Ovis aries]
MGRAEGVARGPGRRAQPLIGRCPAPPLRRSRQGAAGPGLGADASLHRLFSGRAVSPGQGGAWRSGELCSALLRGDRQEEAGLGPNARCLSRSLAF